MYFITPKPWMKWMYPGLTWDIPVESGEKILYLTFDDGPHPMATPFVLEQLSRHDARATFFCIGRNIADHQQVYRDILDAGHTVGNHTYNHLNGWKVSDKEYIADVLKASELIDSKLFRPPYGRISRFQSAVLRRKTVAPDAPADETNLAANPQPKPRSNGFSIIMWSVLAADWDDQIDGEKCFQNVILNARPGCIIVFHDSAKALPRLEYALPRVLEYFRQQGYRFEAIKESML